MDAPRTGAFLYTFTVRLPFVLGIADGLDHDFDLPFDYVTDEVRDVFQRQPFVRIRLFNAPVADRKFWPINMPLAVERFYQGDIGVPDADEHDPHLYEQWLSLETPAAFLAGEPQTDPGYAFHRSLRILNLFLQAFALARDDDAVRPISARELRPLVIIGSLALTGVWTYLGPMLMHPDGKPRTLSSRPVPVHVGALNRAVAAILSDEPFIRSRQWRARAERRKYQGDAADAVVSFQTAAESMVYDLWGLLLVDEGRSSMEIQGRRAAEVPYKSVLSRELAQRLGGRWDLTAQTTPLGRYWSAVYAVRNRIVHAGYLPHDGDAEAAEQAFAGFDRFLEDRLNAKRKTYPRTLLAKVGDGRIESRGWASAWMRQNIARMMAEPSPFYLPRDVAGR